MKTTIPIAIVLSISCVSNGFRFDAAPSLGNSALERNRVLKPAKMVRGCISRGALMAVTSDTMETASERNAKEEELTKRKKMLLKLLGSPKQSAVTPPDQQVKPQNTQTCDPVFACPKTKRPLIVQVSPTLIIDGTTSGVKVLFTTSPSDANTGDDEVFQYEGRTDAYYNLLNPISPGKSDENSSGSSAEASIKRLVNSARTFIPPPLRSAFTTFGILPEDDEYIPMRDLFTSPTVSFAYERGWRQGFAAGGFPGVDKEFEMVNEYFYPVWSSSSPQTIVDMSCATGLFTRRFASSGLYSRVLGCDYSPSMLQEARRRIQSDPKLQSILRDSSSQTKLELVRLDVAAIPMQSNSIDCLHAGAAMHCWPDVSQGLSEIYRVLRPGGRFFATTFLSGYFGMLQNAEGGETGPSKQAFQYFESKEKIEDLLRQAGFEKASVEILGAACVVIRAEK